MIVKQLKFKIGDTVRIKMGWNKRDEEPFPDFDGRIGRINRAGTTYDWIVVFKGCRPTAMDESEFYPKVPEFLFEIK